MAPTLAHVTVLSTTNEVHALYTILRDADTPRVKFIHAADRIIRLLVEQALSLLPFEPVEVSTLTGATFSGLRYGAKICGVSILRAGEAMEGPLRDCCPGIRMGKMLIQRDETTAQPKYYYDKLPVDVADRHVLLLDPMLATGGSACAAIQCLRDRGVPEEHIIFVNLLACPQGLERVEHDFPRVRIVTGAIDPGLNGRQYIVPGLGDFGCRYFGTDARKA